MENLNPIVKKLGLNRILLVCVLILMFLVFKVVLGNKFPAVDSIRSTLNYVYFLGFLSLGVTFVIATGGIDFSIGPVMFCCALISGYTLTTHGISMPVAILISILVGFAFGLFNGYLVAYWSVPSFITSMASMNIAKGLASVYTKTQSVSWPQAADPDNGWFRNLVRYNGFPVGLVILLVAAVICAIILNKTRIGRYILCLGSNSEAVRLSGVDTKKWNMLAYVICGFFAGLASIAYSAIFATVQPGSGAGFELEAIGGAIIGGVSMTGGVGSITGTLFGVFVICLLKTGLPFIGLTANWQQIITGFVLIAAVLVDILKRKAGKE